MSSSLASASRKAIEAEQSPAQSAVCGLDGVLVFRGVVPGLGRGLVRERNQDDAFGWIEGPFERTGCRVPRQVGASVLGDGKGCLLLVGIDGVAVEDFDF